MASSAVVVAGAGPSRGGGRSEVHRPERRRLRADAEGETDLHRAVHDNDSGRAVALIDCGAAIDAKNRHGETALLVSVARKHVDCCRVLLAAGASATARNSAGFVPLVLAASLTTRHEGCDVLRAIADAAPQTLDAFANGYTALHWACVNDCPEAVRALLEAGANPDPVSDPDGHTPAVKAAVYSHVDCIRVLADFDADFDVPDDQGRTPCHVFAATACLDGLKIVLAAGAAHSRPDHSGRTPMRLALDLANLWAVHALAMAGASLSSYDDDDDDDDIIDDVDDAPRPRRRRPRSRRRESRRGGHQRQPAESSSARRSLVPIDD